MAEMVVTRAGAMVADLAAQRLDGDHLAGVVIDVLAKGLADRQGSSRSGHRMLPDTGWSAGGGGSGCRLTRPVRSGFRDGQRACGWDVSIFDRQASAPL